MNIVKIARARGNKLSCGKRTSAAALALVWTLTAAPVPALSQQADALQQWLAQNAVAVRSIDPAEEDFTDLEPLVDAIGAARVVQLGELSHGAGSHFAAKARLVKFLHQRMGFDVLLWESGMYDLQLTQAGLRGGEDPVAAARRGIFSMWSASEQARPLFEYAQASQGTTRPLEMAGFDIQFSGSQSDAPFREDLQAFFAALHGGKLRRRAAELIDAAFEGEAAFRVPRTARGRMYRELSKNKEGKALFDAIQAWEKNERRQLAPHLEDYERFDGAIKGLLELMEREREAFERAHGPRALAFMQRAIGNFYVNGARTYASEAADASASIAAARVRSNDGWNRRDTRNADNLRWLIEDYYADRKIVIWAHNGHVMNAYYAADWGSIHDTPQPGGMKPSGAFLVEWFGDEVYSVGFTGYEGQDQWTSRDSLVTIPPAKEGSLEQRLHLLGQPQLFLDFRALDDTPEHPLRQPQAMRIRGISQPEVMPDLTKVFDAVLYVDRVAPAVRIEEQ